MLPAFLEKREEARIALQVQCPGRATGGDVCPALERAEMLPSCGTQPIGAARVSLRTLRPRGRPAWIDLRARVNSDAGCRQVVFRRRCAQHGQRSPSPSEVPLPIARRHAMPAERNCDGEELSHRGSRRDIRRAREGQRDRLGLSFCTRHAPSTSTEMRRENLTPGPCPVFDHMTDTSAVRAGLRENRAARPWPPASGSSSSNLAGAQAKAAAIRAAAACRERQGVFVPFEHVQKAETLRLHARPVSSPHRPLRLCGAIAAEPPLVPARARSRAAENRRTEGDLEMRKRPRRTRASAAGASRPSPITSTARRRLQQTRSAGLTKSSARAVGPITPGAHRALSWNVNRRCAKRPPKQCTAAVRRTTLIASAPANRLRAGRRKRWSRIITSRPGRVHPTASIAA